MSLLEQAEQIELETGGITQMFCALGWHWSWRSRRASWTSWKSCTSPCPASSSIILLCIMLLCYLLARCKSNDICDHLYCRASLGKQDWMGKQETKEQLWVDVCCEVTLDHGDVSLRYHDCWFYFCCMSISCTFQGDSSVSVLVGWYVDWSWSLLVYYFPGWNRKTRTNRPCGSPWNWGETLLFILLVVVLVLILVVVEVEVKIQY